MISVNTENKSWGYHWKRIFDEIKINNNISDKDLEDFAKYYALENSDDEINVYFSPIPLDFCEDIDVKYYFEYNYLNNILNNSVSLANQIKDYKIKLNSLKKLK